MAKSKLIPIKRDNALVYQFRQLASGANIHSINNWLQMYEDAITLSRDIRGDIRKKYRLQFRVVSGAIKEMVLTGQIIIPGLATKMIKEAKAAEENKQC